MSTDLAFPDGDSHPEDGDAILPAHCRGLPIRSAPKPPVSLLVCDLDGTLLGDDRRLSAEIRAAVAELRDKGILVSLATGRFFQSARQFASELDLDIPIVCANGAQVRCPITGAYLHRLTLPAEICRTVLRKMASERCQPFLFAGDRALTDRDSVFRRRYAASLRVPIEVRDLDEFLTAREEVDILLFYVPDGLEEVARTIEGDFSERVYVTTSAGYFVECLHPAAGKGSGVIALMKMLGIPAQQVAAVGDGPNDLEMLRVVHKAVLLGNAPPWLKKTGFTTTQRGGPAGFLEAMALLGLRVKS